MNKKDSPDEKIAKEYTKTEKAAEEGQKLYYDAMKHLTTLSTGSILILVALLEKLFTAPKWRLLIAAAFLSFVISIVFSFSRMIHSAHSIHRLGDVKEDLKRIKNISFYTAITSFLGGLLCLIIFALRNLF